MSREEVERMVDSVLIKLLKIDAGSVVEASRESVKNWTSLMHVEIFFSLEEEADVRFSDDDIAFSESRNEIVEAVLTAISTN